MWYAIALLGGIIIGVVWIWLCVVTTKTYH